MSNELLCQIKNKALVVRVMSTKDANEFTGNYDYEATKEAYDIIYAADKSPWIPVTPETMPEPGEKVLILHMGIVCEAINSLYEDHKSFYVELTDEVVPYEKISHWMKRPPIPALPEQGEG